MIDQAIKLGHEVVAITEHETIASAIDAENYYNKIKKDNPNFKVILGNEIYLCRNGLNPRNYDTSQDKWYHFILLAKDEIGHKQIRELSTRAWMRAEVYRKMMRVPTYYQDLYDIIGKNPGHVIASTACLGGALPTQILRNRERGDNSLWDKIKLWCTTLNNLFKGDFYLEMQPSNNEEQIYVNNKIIELSEELNIPFIITNDAHYLNKAQRPIHKAFLNAKDGDREVDDFYATTYLMDDVELKSFMEKHIGLENMEKAYKSIREIKNKCQDYSLKKSLKIPRLSWKQYRETTQIEEWLKRIPMLKTFLNSEYSEDVHLAKVVIDILEHNPMNDETLNTQATYDELNACFDDIWVSSEANNARWSAYLLNLQNIIDLCWEAGSLVGPGRGSGVGFLLLYILGITQINPLREKAKTFRFRFLNPKRVSPLDVDIDIESTKREVVLNSFRKQYGDDRVAGVMTFKTEGSKSAILTAARGLGIDNDIAQYLASMIEAERGQLRTLNQTFYGDAENDIKPNKQFRYEMETNYPELWEVAKNIEGLCCGVGVHAGGVVFVDEPFTESNALMRSPKGEIITQFDLHQSESVGNIKYDVLSIKGLDNIHNCLTLLGDYGYIPQDTLKNMYENTVGIYNLEREDINMWKMLWNHEVFSLFQMEKQSGINGIEVLKPTSVEDLAILNSTIRLMAQEKGGEMPTDKLARFKSDPSEWDDELRRNGLGQEARELLEPILGLSYGLCIAQEQFMQLVQLPELGGFPLEFADRLRKSIAKKNPAEYEEVTKEFYQVTAAKGCDDKLCRYVWDKLIAMSRGYGFNLSHTLAYSLVGLQELNLAYLYPVLFWNCACLIVDSGSAGAGENEDEEEEYEYEEEEYDDDDIFYEETEEQDEVEETVKKTTKKKAIKHDYGRIATAIGKMRADGVGIQSPDINSSYYTFSPNIDDNMILFGLSGITKVGQELVQAIMANRPYTSIEDFLSKVKVNKTQMVSLIKSGAFDNLYGGDRRLAMDTYIDIIADKKKRITLQNMQKLIQYGLIPQEYELQIRFFNFNKYLRKLKCGTYFNLDNIAYQFYEKYCDIDDLVPNVEAESGFHIDATTWKKKYYDKQMDIIRPWVKSNSETLLRKVNDRLRKEVCDKYATGEINKWEMDAVSCYFHKHELEDVDAAFYGCDHFEDLPEDPDIDYTFVKNGRTIPIFKINRIMGTVLDRDKLKKTVTLLTTDGVVTVKIYGQIFSNYDKQISEKGADGKKHIVEKSWFTRGNKIIVTGMRRGTNEFVAKKYKKTPYHLVELITSVDGSYLETRGEREDVE